MKTKSAKKEKTAKKKTAQQPAEPVAVEKPAGPGLSIGRKLAMIAVPAIILAVGIFIIVLLYTEKAMVQLPVLYQKDARITFIIGNAWFRTSGYAEWEQAIVGQALKAGCEVKTGADSQMDIRFHDEMAVRVSDNSVVRLDALTVKNLNIYIDQGSLYGRFEKLFKNYGISVKTPTTIAGIRGTELGFEITEDQKDKKKKPAARPEPGPVEEPKRLTTVYSISGITELYNPRFGEEKVLLSYQNKIAVRENEPPSDPAKLSEEELQRIRSKLNSIHTQEVLFISDKINFEVNSATILPSSYGELEKIVKILREKDARVRIEGHTDSQGTAPFNQTLSVQRALSIRKYLVQKGIDPGNLAVAGYGSSKPVASNMTEKGRALNRRVEFIVIE
jgi:outer membrane protein OmpA-like peptidoglycan-associated protein